MSALFDVSSLLTCLLLAVCTCAYLRALTFRANSAVPSLLDHARHGFGELSARRRSRLHLCFFSPKCCRLDIDQILGCDYGAQPFWGESRASLCTSRCSLIVSTRGEVDGERLLPPPPHTSSPASTFPYAGSAAWKLARVGERLSPWVSLGCACMAAYALLK